ncbi:MAG: DNA cytosine methyltransferase [Candidatus Helarchaeota archaeon]|nr:DNA cytosine methyltransferase [Candidatus Helarchaeota archaeon]
MNYLEFLHKELTLPEPQKEAPLVLDLFAGCGGLALGFEAVGFRTIGFEILEDACATYNKNLNGNCFRKFLKPGQDLVGEEKVDVVIGGPPCQPFSVGGYQNGPDDSRDGFPAFLWTVERYKPRIFIFENVRGMQYRNKIYLSKIISKLAAYGYIVEPPMILNALHYGVPQKRERLFVVGHHGGWQPPNRVSLRSPYTVGDALGNFALCAPTQSKFLTPSMDKYIAKYEKKSNCIRPRDLRLDEPSRTVTCRNLYGATGDMLRIRLPDGRRRMLTIQEGARLQSFPDWFIFIGSEGSQFKQIGNAVPPLMAKAVARSALAYLNDTDRKRSEKIEQGKFLGQMSFEFIGQ